MVQEEFVKNSILPPSQPTITWLWPKKQNNTLLKNVSPLELWIITHQLKPNICNTWVIIKKRHCISPNHIRAYILLLHVRYDSTCTLFARLRVADDEKKLYSARCSTIIIVFYMKRSFEQIVLATNRKWGLRQLEWCILWWISKHRNEQSSCSREELKLGSPSLPPPVSSSNRILQNVHVVMLIFAEKDFQSLLHHEHKRWSRIFSWNRLGK